MRLQVLRSSDNDAGVQPVSGELLVAKLRLGQGKRRAHNVHCRYGEREVSRASSGKNELFKQKNDLFIKFVYFIFFTGLGGI